MYAIENASLLPRRSGSAADRPRLAAAGRGLAGLWQAWRNRRAIAHLARLDNHMLADVGITRGDVQAALAVPLGQDPARHLAALRAERRLAGRRSL